MGFLPVNWFLEWKLLCGFCPAYPMSYHPSWISSLVPTFSNVSPPALVRLRECPPLPSPLGGQMPGFHLGAACLQHSWTSITLSLKWSCLPRSTASQEALGNPCHFHRPAACWSWCHHLLLGEAQSKLLPHIRTTFTKPLITAPFSRLVFLQSRCSLLVTRCLSQGVWSCGKGKTHFPIVCVFRCIRCINPGRLHDGALGLCCTPLLSAWGVYGGREKWPVT